MDDKQIRRLEAAAIVAVLVLAYHIVLHTDAPDSVFGLLTEVLQ